LKVVAVAPDVLVATSRIYQTSCTIVRSGDEGFVIDSPVLPDELEVLPHVLDQAGFPFTGLLATHADWDHLLARLAWPDAAIGVAESSAARLKAEPGRAALALREFDEEHYVARERPLSLGSVQALPVPGHCAVGELELELHPADGHTADGMAIFIPWASVLVCGDYLSPVEIPMLSPGGSRSGYAATLRRLAPLVQRSESVVAGHGGVIGRDRALELLEQDLAYIEALPGAELPAGRRGAVQRGIHADNVARCA
jgi:glyoxylase-like metal-dependent hydrolase (beta-lactamase superfamily II)